ncbi:ABC transporter permease [Embleya sp. AB8]|uniref:ABC transporter permease n=1 Tax=Embleya sp. AB8 TaxID=3156304 RepID=UPI003C76F908
MTFTLTMRALRAQHTRLLLTVVSIMCGVAFVTGTLIFTDTIDRQAGAVAGRSGRGVAVDVRAASLGGRGAGGAGAPVPAEVLETVRAVDGVRDPYGVVTGYAAVLGRAGRAISGQGPQSRGAAAQSGINWIPGGDHDLTAGRAPRGADEVAVDADTAHRARVRLGDTVTVQLKGAAQPMRLVGLIAAADLQGATLTAFDTPTAQRLLLGPGLFTEIRAGAAGAVDERTLRDRVARVLPADLRADTGTALRARTASDLASALEPIRLSLLVFAAISVLVGAFIIVNTFAMLVARRTRELALLRVLGAGPRQLARLIRAEAGAVGAIASVLGIGAGVGLAAGLRVVFDAGPAGGLAVSAPTVATGFAVGIGVTLVAAHGPARRAARIAPIAALREDEPPAGRRSTRRRAGIGGGIVGLGAALAGVGSVAPGGVSGVLLPVAGAFVAFVGVVVLTPILARPVIGGLGAVLPRLFGMSGRLARENALRNPRRTAATAAALMIGLALVAAVNVLGASMSASVHRTMDREFTEDYLVRPRQSAGFDPAAVALLGAAPGVHDATATYQGSANVGGTDVQYTAGGMPATVAGIADRMISGTATLGADGVLVDEDLANSKGWHTGSVVQARFPDGARQTLRIVGVYPVGMSGSMILPEAIHRAHTRVLAVNAALVTVAHPGPAARAALEQALRAYPDLGIWDRTQYIAERTRGIDRLVRQFTLLLALSIVVAAVGVINTVALSVLERTREIGLLRAVGAHRRQIRRMIRLEAILITTFGAALGLALGTGLGVAVQHAFASQGFDVLRVPAVPLALCAALAVLIGVGAAVWPARRAARLPVLAAVAAA